MNSKMSIKVNFRYAIYMLFAIFLLSACNSNKSYTKTRKNHRTTKNKSYSKRTTKSKTKKIASSDQLRSKVIHTAKQYKGTKYVYGGKKPGGFDCSGFITYVMNKHGINLKGSSSMIAKQGKKIDKSKLKKGDLVFFGKGSKVTHIAMVVENKSSLKVIHSTSSRGVVIDDITNSKYWQKKYLFGKAII